MSSSPPPDNAPARKVSDRVKRRKQIQNRAAMQARERVLEHHMSMRCWELRVLHQGPENAAHALCKKADCLCECHDNPALGSPEEEGEPAE